VRGQHHLSTSHLGTITSISNQHEHLDEDQDHGHITLDVTKLQIDILATFKASISVSARVAHLHEEVTRSLLSILEYMQRNTSKALRSCLDIATRFLYMPFLSRRLCSLDQPLPVWLSTMLIGGIMCGAAATNLFASALMRQSTGLYT
jgi:hypothetical protein